MTPDDMKARTKRLALSVIRLVDALPKARPVDVIARQLLKSGTSIGANYRAVCRSRSDADFLARMGVVEEETDETLYWLELLVEGKLVQPKAIDALAREAHEVLSIVVASINTVKARLRNTPKSSHGRKSEIRIPRSEMGGGVALG